MGIQTDFDLEGKRVEFEYPYVLLPEVNDTTPIVVKLLQTGNMQLVAVYKGCTKVVARISNSAFNLDKLLRTHSEVSLCVNPKEKYYLDSVTDYLEAITWI